MTTNIFEAAKEKTIPQWMKFVNPGDSIQGTYIGQIVGQIDGYGNEQIIYQILKEDGTVVNVGFGLNKKFLHKDMKDAKFGEILGFKYKDTITVKDKFGKPVKVKDYALYRDPKIVNEKWLKENASNMPVIVRATNEDPKIQKELSADDIPFSSEGSLTNDDQLALITKLAKEKLNVHTDAEIKDKVMNLTSLAFIPSNYGAIVEKLTAM